MSWETRTLSRPEGLEAAPRGLLGKNTDLPSPPPLEHSFPSSFQDHGEAPFPDGQDIGKTAAPRVCSRWMARAHGRDLLAGVGFQGRVRFCGRGLSHGKKFVEVWSRPDHGVGRLGGLCMCGQPLTCPVCSPRVSAFRAAEVADAFERAAALGWKADLLVMTAPHSAASSLSDEMDFWTDAWEKFLGSGKAAARLRKHRFGHLGGPEMTYGQNGWHFHRNLVVFHDGQLDLEAYRSRWLGCLGKRYTLAAEQHAFRASPIDTALRATYVSKIAAEVAWSHGKASSTPLTMLVRAAAEAASCPQWVEAVHAVKARKLSIIRFSRGLRGGLGMNVEEPDERIAEEAATPTEKLLGVITAGQMRQVIARRAEYRLLQVAQEGEEAVNVFLLSIGAGELFGSVEFLPLQLEATK